MGQLESRSNKLDVPVSQATDWGQSGVYGCIVLSTGHVMVTDYRNNKVKVIDIDMGNIISAFRLTSGPADLTNCAYTKVAVTLPTERRIQLLHVVSGDTDISLDYSIRVDGKCVAIDYDYPRFVVSFLDPAKIQVIDINGIVKHTIQRNQWGDFIFQRPLSIFLSRDRKSVFSCDADTQKVMKIDLTSLEVLEENRSIVRPMGVIELPDNSLIVVSADQENRWANAVHHLDPRLQRTTAVLTSQDGIYLPQALCLRQRGTKIFDLIISNTNGTILSNFRVKFR